MSKFQTHTLSNLLRPGAKIRETNLRSEFGGQLRGRIITPSDSPYILVIVVPEDRHEGQKWEIGSTVHCVGEGSSRNIWTTRNAAIRDHAKNEKKLVVYKALKGQQNGMLKCLGQYRYESHEVFQKLGKDNVERHTVRFNLIPAEPEETIQNAMQAGQALVRAVAEAQKELERLGPQKLATRIRGGRPQQLTATTTLFQRDHNVIALVLYRARGSCEGCGQQAPFVKPDGQPYLEVHHVQPLADGGYDEPGNALALCPTCHRRAHHSCDRDEFTAELRRKLTSKSP